MAYLIAAADGNWTTAATWGTVDATSLLDSQANATALGTTDTVSTATFTPGAITIDGIALKVATRAASPSGTMTVTLYNSTDSSTTTDVTINVSDLPLHKQASAGATIFGCSVGWVFFKFQTSTTLLAAKAYRIRAKTSVASQVNLFRDATAGNWSRLLRTTTAAAPGAGDSMFIVKEYASAGVATARTVTYDGTGTTDYGGTSQVLASLGIGDGCTLQYSNASSLTLNLRLSGLLQVWVGGTLTIGTVANPIPSNSTATLEFDSVATGDFGLIAWGNVALQGVSRGISKTFTFLAADAATSATVLTTVDATGWQPGDAIVVAGTRRVRDEADVATVTTVSSTQVTITAGLTYYHHGSTTDFVRAEVINITRNVVVQSVTAGAGSYILTPQNSVVTFDMDWARLINMYGTGTSAKAGLTIDDISLQTVTINNSVLSGSGTASSSQLFYSATNASGSTTLTFTDNICWWSAAGPRYFAFSSATGPLTLQLTNHVSITNSNSSSGDHVYIQGYSLAVIFSNCWFSGGTCRAVSLIGNYAAAGGWYSQFFWNGGAVHSMGANTGAMDCNYFAMVALDNVNFWRTNVAGSGYGALANSGSSGHIILRDCVFRGNSSYGIGILADIGLLRILRCKFGAETGYTGTGGISYSMGQTTVSVRLEHVQFGTAAGALYTNFSGSDIQGSLASDLRSGQFTLVNCETGTTTDIVSPTLYISFQPGSFVSQQRIDGATNTHKRQYPLMGEISYDTTTTRTAAPSEKITLLSTGIATTSNPMESSPKYVSVNSGSTVTISMYAQKNSAYTGNQPKLVLKANPAVGITSDTVIDTMTAGANTWEQLTGSSSTASEDGVLTFVLQITGNAGAVWTDDWSAS